MQLEDYLDFLVPNDIQVKGRRVGMEKMLMILLGVYP